MGERERPPLLVEPKTNKLKQKYLDFLRRLRKAEIIDE